MKKFVKFSKLNELKKTELQNVKGGQAEPNQVIKPYPPQVLYGIMPLYGIRPDEPCETCEI